MPADTKNASTWTRFWCPQEGRGWVEGLVWWLGVVGVGGYASHEKRDTRHIFRVRRVLLAGGDGCAGNGG